MKDCFELEHCNIGPGKTNLPNINTKWMHICTIVSELDAVRVALALSKEVGRIRVSGIFTQFFEGRPVAPPKDEAIQDKILESVHPYDDQLCYVFKFKK